MKSAQKWTQRRERLYQRDQSVVQVGGESHVDAEWRALNQMTKVRPCTAHGPVCIAWCLALE